MFPPPSGNLLSGALGSEKNKGAAFLSKSVNCNGDLFTIYNAVFHLFICNCIEFFVHFNAT